jgi:hypothetical protein
MRAMALIAALVLAILPLAGCDEAVMGMGTPAPVPVYVPPRPDLGALPPPPAAPPANPAQEADLASLTPPEPAGGPVVVIPAVPEPMAVAAPQIGNPAPSGPAAESPLLAQQRAACAREGGRMTSLPSGLVSCIRQTRDAGRTCTGARDCEGVCLARTGTCAPIAPLYGCHEVLLAPGSRVTQCLD